MTTIRVKICGITTFKDLSMAVKAGADALGFIVDVPQSPRNLTVSQAKELINSVPLFVDAVAVTVPTDLTHLKNIYNELNPTTIQIHGLNHLNSEIRKVLPNARLIGAVSVKSNRAIRTATEAAKVFDAILLDSYVTGEYGGTGKTHDWEFSKQIRMKINKPVILAGGLNSENVANAIHTVKPYAVDVSSGVELQPGLKNSNEVKNFIKTVEEVEI